MDRINLLFSILIQFFDVFFCLFGFPATMSFILSN